MDSNRYCGAVGIATVEPREIRPVAEIARMEDWDLLLSAGAAPDLSAGARVARCPVYAA